MAKKKKKKKEKEKEKGKKIIILPVRSFLLKCIVQVEIRSRPTQTEIKNGQYMCACDITPSTRRFNVIIENCW